MLTDGRTCVADQLSHFVELTPSEITFTAWWEEIAGATLRGVSSGRSIPTHAGMHSPVFRQSLTASRDTEYCVIHDSAREQYSLSTFFTVNLTAPLSTEDGGAA